LDNSKQPIKTLKQSKTDFVFSEEEKTFLIIMWPCLAIPTGSEQKKIQIEMNLATKCRFNPDQPTSG